VLPERKNGQNTCKHKSSEKNPSDFGKKSEEVGKKSEGFGKNPDGSDKQLLQHGGHYPTLLFRHDAEVQFVLILAISVSCQIVFDNCIFC